MRPRSLLFRGMLSVLCLAILASASPSRAAVSDPAAGLDQVLSALAKTIEKRGKRIVSRAVARAIVRELSMKTVTVKSKRTGQVIVFHMGEEDNAETKGKPSDKVTHYGIFTDTFRLLKSSEFSISDPYLLRVLAQEALGFSLRLAAVDFNAAAYDRQGLSEFCPFLYESMNILAQPNPDVYSLAAPLLALVDRLDHPEAASDQVSDTDFEALSAPLVDSTRGDLSAFIRAVGLFLQASKFEQKETTDWLRKATLKLRDLAASGSPSSSAFGDWARSGDGKAPKDLVFLPRCVEAISSLSERPRMQIENHLGKPQMEALRWTLITFQNVSDMKGESRGTVASQLSLLVKRMTEFMDVAIESEHIRAKGEIKGEAPLKDALAKLAALLDKLAQKNWVGVAADLSEDLSKVAQSHSDRALERSLAFFRTLMAMYQAPNAETAQRIFEAMLEDEGSRESRYDRWSFDFGAHLGFRYGGQHSDLVRKTVDSYGIHAPLGLLISKSWFGSTLYVADLGGYLTRSKAETPEARLTDALRMGVDVYFRPTRFFPVALGYSGDLRPDKTANDVKYRNSIFVSMDMPLFLIR